MSALTKSKLDLLVRVRYNNSLPAPPFPPKLVKIPTDPSRYARPEFTTELAYEAALPMVVDAECGMPLDLGKWECLWEENADKSALTPSAVNKPELDPEDQFLVSDTYTMPGQSLNGTVDGPAAPAAPVHVSWLRKTEYITRETFHRTTAFQDIKPVEIFATDISRAAQINDIEATFSAANDSFDLTVLKHPNKAGITAVAAYDILPDAEIWANAYDLFKFSERPGERNIEMEDPRLDCAILRPMESDGDHFLAYYLTKDDGPAELFRESRFLGDYKNLVTSFSWVRDYETVKIEQDVPNEFLIVLDDGDLPPLRGAEDGTLDRRSKGAFYKNIERKITLKKRRVNQNETVAYTDKWDVIHLSYAPLSFDEAEERKETQAEVIDPMFLFSRVEGEGEQDGEGEADGDGEVDAEAEHEPDDFSQNATSGHAHSPLEDSLEVS